MLRKASSAENRAPPVQPLCQIGGDDSSRILLRSRIADGGESSIRQCLAATASGLQRAKIRNRTKKEQWMSRESMMNRGRELCSKFVASMDECFTDRWSACTGFSSVRCSLSRLRIGDIRLSMSRTSTVSCWYSTIPKACLALEPSILVWNRYVRSGLVLGKATGAQFLCFGVSFRFDGRWPKQGSVLSNVCSDHREEVKVCVYWAVNFPELHSASIETSGSNLQKPS